MKCIIRSIKPYWFYLICEGRKTIEVGKNIPKQWENTPIFIYCTKDDKSFKQIPVEFQEKYNKFVGKIGACFYVDSDELLQVPFEVNDYNNSLLLRTCLTEEQLNDYGKNYKFLHGWSVSSLEVFETPKLIEEFYKPGASNFKSMYNPIIDNEWKIVRPPQSWFTAEYF